MTEVIEAIEEMVKEEGVTEGVSEAGVGECVVGDILEGYLEKEKMFELDIK